AVGEVNGDLLFLVVVEIALLGLLARFAVVSLDLVNLGVDPGAFVGEDVLHRQQARGNFFQLLVDLLHRWRGLLVGGIGGFRQLAILGVALNFLLRLRGLRARALLDRAIALLAFRLILLPGPLSVGFVPQRPEQRAHQ